MNPTQNRVSAGKVKFYKRAAKFRARFFIDGSQAELIGFLIGRHIGETIADRRIDREPAIDARDDRDLTLPRAIGLRYQMREDGRPEAFLV